MSNTSNIVVVVSTPRSGSSWLSRLLRAHPGLHVYTHNTQDNHLLYMLRPLKSLNPFGDDYTDARSRADRLFWGRKLRLLRSAFRSPSPDRKLLIATPTTAAFLPLIVEGFPDAKFVHLQRDPLDRIASFRTFMRKSVERGLAQRYRNSRHRGRLFAARQAAAHWFHLLRWAAYRPHGYLGTRPAGFRRAAKLPPLEFLCWYYRQYENEIQEALARVPEERKHVCTYEGLVTDYAREIRRLMDFIGVPTPDEFLQKTAATVRPDGIGGHRKHFTAAELAEVRRHLSGAGAPGAAEISCPA
jgi:hypothetical protein